MTFFGSQFTVLILCWLVLYFFCLKPEERLKEVWIYSMYDDAKEVLHPINGFALTLFLYMSIHWYNWKHSKMQTVWRRNTKTRAITIVVWVHKSFAWWSYFFLYQFAIYSFCFMLCTMQPYTLCSFFFC